MPTQDLPPRASLEYLKKLAKERLRDLRRADPAARLADAQREVARAHGFRSWRALKAEVDRRAASSVEAFVLACREGDQESLRRLLEREPSLARARLPGGTTGLHLAAAHPAALRVLLEWGADPDARDDGDHALPLHFAAGHGPVESVRLLLDAGSDVQGEGDLHRLDVIGWATVFDEARRDVVRLLVERGARHHVFSAVALGDHDLLRALAAEDPTSLARRLSPSEQEQTALHYVVAPPDGLVGGRFRTGGHYATLELLIELGADLEARDAKGRTPLEVAMLRGDTEAMRRLYRAGAQPTAAPAERPPAALAALARSVSRLRPMLAVADVARTVAWYRALGFRLLGSHGEGQVLDWASVALGAAEIMLVPARGPAAPPARVTLWLETDRLDELYALVRERQLAWALATLDGGGDSVPGLAFTADLYTASYGQREFGLLDPDGVELMFYQPLPPPEGER